MAAGLGANVPSASCVTVDPVGVHPIMFEIEQFTVEDEHYRFLDVAPAATVLALTPCDGDAHPAMWTAGPRVFVDALGHDERSLTHPAHSNVLRRAARWLNGASDAAVGQTERTPGQSAEGKRNSADRRDSIMIPGGAGG